ncbi:ATP-grasp peptide maturase system methyltransferase [Actinosynnema mirum]|uniref:Protein-L-isoaspartate O-methyltransferase n=1 Tax=Actinosynnema mirum (strain ATCC 29888 / DSM 43827 / JCM 3225 / NBRC 14064 / NCIMB 13271 / NRRL B-12336 / IMRU 3971 / 101) TaxID=446462 RepID=C6WF30_ACTMD|nr:ATP-grasp peptide maturase system methyltransferase [Actinosynnema mirum]ACU34162.1 protein-L-isoaspartate(D-aspartate)O-methyltrans ferase [Actinosynnema mirum DSM 43827]
MTTVPEDEWRERAAALADMLGELGKLTDPAWREAVRAVPRHVLVPRFHTQDTNGTWVESSTSTKEGRAAWLDAVYSNKPLVTALRQDAEVGRVVSSSSQPGLMTRMLEALDIRDGHRVLEIGTGTGYNAALLSHRLGGENVFSVDVEPDLVDLARSRLAELGHAPTLVAANGALGLAEHAPFDRIIATCAVPAIPWAWIEQLRVGGTVLTDLKITQNAGNLVKVTRTSEHRAEGRFDPTYAAFMGLRHQPGGPAQPVTRAARDSADVHESTSPVDPQTPWKNMVVWFLAALDLHADVTIGYTGPSTTSPPTAVTLSTSDGSWAQIALAGAHGLHEVTQGGPQRLWQAVENAHDLWNHLSRPDWGQFGLTITPNSHTLWHDRPDSEQHWTHLTEMIHGKRWAKQL